MRKLKKDLDLWATMILPVNEKISERAAALEETYTLSHGLELADAFIAATAIEYQEPLLTGNIRHYAYMPDLQTVPFHR
jgi:predicted nucleic acid-binding protein